MNVSQEMIGRIKAVYFGISGEQMTENDVSEVIVVAAQIGDFDEYYLSNITISRANRISSERNQRNIERLIQSINDRFSNFATSDIEKMSEKLRDELEGIKYKTDAIISDVQHTTEYIIAQNAMSIIDQIAKHAEDELFRNVVNRINERVNIAVSKSVKWMWLLAGCVVGGSIGVLVTWVLHHPAIFQ